ncbi:MAG: hypothetical protein HY508_03370 [Acidobacteria bacterium]|nr:hypothetical protein [Acidobacteriota bacterium]
MRCKDVQENIIEGSLDQLAREHLAACARCQSFARDAETVQAGFELLATDVVPEPSWGFAARVLRGLDESPARVFGSLETIGRRAVLAAGVVAMTVMMVLALSSTGPVRGRGQGSFSLARADSSESLETLLAGGVDEYEEINLLPVSAMGGESH